MKPILDIRRDGAVARVTLARPEVRNAFDDALVARLHEAFSSMAVDDAVRVIVLAGTGKAFCAGGDLNWMRRMAGYAEAENLADARALAGMLRAVHECPKPVVARVHGDAFAGGLGLVAACDIAVAVRGARFCLSEVRLGLIPATIAPYVVAALGPRASARYFLTAEVFAAPEAERLGLVHECVEDEAALDGAVARHVESLLAAGPGALAACKRLLGEVAGRPLDDALVEDTARRIAAIRATAEGREGVRAFLEKRPPAWRGSAQGAA